MLHRNYYHYYLLCRLICICKNSFLDTAWDKTESIAIHKQANQMLEIFEPSMYHVLLIAFEIFTILYFFFPTHPRRKDGWMVWEGVSELEKYESVHPIADSTSWTWLIQMRDKYHDTMWFIFSSSPASYTYWVQYLEYLHILLAFIWLLLATFCPLPLT